MVYSTAGRGSLGVREIDDAIAGDKGPGIFLHGVGHALAMALLNSRASSYLLRGLTAGGINFNGFYVSLLPIWFARKLSDHVDSAASACISLTRHLASGVLTERSFRAASVRAGSLARTWRDVEDTIYAVAAMLHGLEGDCEHEVFAAYGIQDDDVTAIVGETGTPAGWFPSLAGYDTAPDASKGITLSPNSFGSVLRASHDAPLPTEIAEIKRRLQTIYEAGPRAGTAEETAETLATENNDDDEEEEEESEDGASGALLPIPCETLIEELSQKLEFHPFSVYWLLRELREKEGVVCLPELRRFVEDHFTVLILRLLGHRWPKQIEAAEPLPTWVDQDGVIPLVEEAGEPPLVARVRDRIAEDFGADRIAAIEQEFQQIMGKPLAAWISADFFKRHISQFKKRPIAWQIESRPAPGSKRRGRRVAKGAPAFSCLVYYHRVNADLLPKIRTQYVGPLRTRTQTELHGLETIAKRSAEQDTRRLELESKLEELRDFDTRLAEVSAAGFSSAALDVIAAKEPLDGWTSRDGLATAAATREAFLAQERRYDPDINDGVRVNIAPFQKAGLLAAEVLAAKDLDKAIADRAEWRADERRWCREKKLPRPGWWPPAPDDTKG